MVPQIMLGALLVLPSFLELKAVGFDVPRAYALAQVVPPHLLGLRMLPILAPLLGGVLLGTLLNPVMLKLWMGRRFDPSRASRFRLRALLALGVMLLAATIILLVRPGPLGGPIFALVVVGLTAMEASTVLLNIGFSGAAAAAVGVLALTSSFALGSTDSQASLDPFGCAAVTLSGPDGKALVLHVDHLVDVQTDGVWRLQAEGALNFTAGAVQSIVACKT